MRASHVVAWVASYSLVACGGGLPDRGPSVPSAGPSTNVARPARAGFTVVPAELSDRDVLARLRHRTRLARYGKVWLRLDGDAVGERTPGKDDESLDHVVPVIGETGDKLRIVFEDDDARLAIWIPRADTWMALAMPVQLADGSGGPVTAWLGLGAPVEIVQRTGARRLVRLHDDGLALAHHVPASALAHVWVVPVDQPPPKSLRRGELETRLSPSAPRPRAVVRRGAHVYGAPAGDAPVLATVRAERQIVALLEARGAYREIEIVRPHARVRGFVPASDLTPTEEDTFELGTGGGHGFGMSHADRLEIPAGTCLYEAIAGEVVGTQEQARTRLGRLRTGEPGWSKIFIATSWSVLTVYVRDLGTDPKQPVWESCVLPPHR